MRALRMSARLAAVWLALQHAGGFSTLKRDKFPSVPTYPESYRAPDVDCAWKDVKKRDYGVDSVIKVKASSCKTGKCCNGLTSPERCNLAFKPTGKGGNTWLCHYNYEDGSCEGTKVVCTMPSGSTVDSDEDYPVHVSQWPDVRYLSFDDAEAAILASDTEPKIVTVQKLIEGEAASADYDETRVRVVVSAADKFTVMDTPRVG